MIIKQIWTFKYSDNIYESNSKHVLTAARRNRLYTLRQYWLHKCGGILSSGHILSHFLDLSSNLWATILKRSSATSSAREFSAPRFRLDSPQIMPTSFMLQTFVLRFKHTPSFVNVLANSRLMSSLSDSFNCRQSLTKYAESASKRKSGKNSSGINQQRMKSQRERSNSSYLLRVSCMRQGMFTLSGAPSTLSHLDILHLSILDYYILSIFYYLVLLAIAR